MRIHIARLAVRAAFAGGLLVSTARPDLAQEPAWSLQVGVGDLRAAHRSALLDPRTRISLGRNSPLITAGVLRQLDCCVELYANWLVPRMHVEIANATTSMDASRVAPIGFQGGLNYRLLPRIKDVKRSKWWIYVTPFVSTFSDDRSALVHLPEDGSTRDVLYRFRSSLGVGAGLGARYRVYDQLALDFAAKSQHMPVFVANDGRLPWHPSTFTVAIVTRLY